MQVIHKIDDFLYTIFPETKGMGTEMLINTLQKYYTYGPYKPKVSVDKDLV